MQTQTASVPTRLGAFAPSHTYFIGDSTSAHNRIFQGTVGFRPLTAVPTVPFVERPELPELPFRRSDAYEPQLFSDYYLSERQQSRERQRREECQMSQALSAQQTPQVRRERRRPQLRIQTTFEEPFKPKWETTHDPIRNQPSLSLPSSVALDLDPPRPSDPLDARSPSYGRQRTPTLPYHHEYTLGDFYDDFLFALQAALVVVALFFWTMGCILAFSALLEFGFPV